MKAYTYYDVLNKGRLPKNRPNRIRNHHPESIGVRLVCQRTVSEPAQQYLIRNRSKLKEIIDTFLNFFGH
jgi:hypothetical protein